MGEIIEFLHPWLAFITLVVVLANHGYQMGVRNEYEKLVKKAKDHDLMMFDRELYQWRFKLVREILEEHRRPDPSQQPH